jgi:DNA-binding NarL/FixJ family response regulator
MEHPKAWQDLIEGRARVVDGFVSDGRRFLVVERPARGHKLARPLAALDRRILVLARAGQANKAIAYELGVLPSTVSMGLRRIAARLGLRSRLELVGVLAGARP